MAESSQPNKIKKKKVIREYTASIINNANNTKNFTLKKKKYTQLG